MRESIGKKSIIRLLILSVVLVFGTSIAAGTQLYGRNMEIYEDMAESFAVLASINIDQNMVLELLDNAEEYRAFFQKFMEAEPDEKDKLIEQEPKLYELHKFWTDTELLVVSGGNLATNIRSLYVGVPTEEGFLMIWDSDLSSERAEPLKLVPYDEGTKAKLLRDMESHDEDTGRDLILRRSNGEICGTISAPIMVDAGENTERTIALAVVDISVTGIRSSFLTLLLRIALVILVIMFITIVIYYRIFRSQVITPVLKLKRAAENLSSNLEKDEQLVIDVHTGDEIDSLARSFEEMTARLKTYIRENASITAERERIGTELSLAARIQADMLPSVFPAFPERKDFDLYASMRPAREVGGDFYDFFMVEEDRLALVIADVSGKGVPAALFMMISKLMIRNFAMTGMAPAEVLERVNEQICANNREQMFVTVWLGILDLKTGAVTAVNAGHEYPFLAEPEMGFKMYRDPHGFVIGGMEEVTYTEYSFQMKPGSTLFVYTDGLPEATNEAEELFGDERSEAALNEVRGKSPREIIESVECAAREFVGKADQFDDMTMLCLTWFGPDGSEGKPDRVNELVVPALKENLDRVQEFVSRRLVELHCSERAKYQIEVAVEEIFINIVHYAYNEEKDGSPGTGMVSVTVEEDEDPRSITVTISDAGTPYDPLSRPDPDVTLSAEERGIGGLGIYMVKKTMDDVRYTYKNGKNILSFRKDL